MEIKSLFEIIQREFIYIRYYFEIQLSQIFWYWIFGMVIGSAVSVFFKHKIHTAFQNMNQKNMGICGILIASALGIASPLCMYGTIPIAASFSKSGIKDEWLAAFMMSSILLNPQLIIYSAALGSTLLCIRIIECFLGGIMAGVLVFIYCKKNKNPFFNFNGFKEPSNHDTDPNIIVRYIKNLGRNVKATGLYFLIGILLSALFQRYVPAEVTTALFGKSKAFGVLIAASIGVPLYACGGGTIPLLQEWLWQGMSFGSASAFMFTGPATKITNLGALTIVLGKKHFLLYLGFILVLSFIIGLIVNVIF